MNRPITIALAGNPNSGKTTIFNNLTGAHQHVGNYPGVTVEKKEGVCYHRGHRIQVVDLPGTYSLTAYSVEEVVARDFIIEQRPDVVVHVVDASNLERNLYLTTQLIELGAPLVLALNMSDIAERRGLAIDGRRLGELLGARVVPTVGHRGKGTPELLDAIVGVGLGTAARASVAVTYGREIDEEVTKLAAVVAEEPQLVDHYPPRWLAVKLLEDDPIVRECVERRAGDAARLLGHAEASRHHIRTVFGESPELVIADRRYGFISGACQEAVVRTVEARHSLSDRIDAVVMHRGLGIPIFLLFTYLMFQFTFTVGDAPTSWVESLFGWLGDSVARLWPKSSASPIRSLLVDGVIAGVGGVLTFVPYIMLLFLAISVLEDTGYMARAAFIMDRVMHKIGLHGKSFIPMLLGFGCSVPAIMATRTLDTRRDRLTTMLVIPLMSCSARLVIYSVIIGAFFRNRVLVDAGVLQLRVQPLMFFVIYLIGILLGIGGAKLLRTTILRGETTPLVMELPPYRMPTLKGLIIHMWERAWLYVKKAGTIILAFSIVLWALTSYPRKTDFAQDYAAREVAARHRYVEGVRALAEPLGIPRHGDQLARLARAEMDLAAADRSHYDWEQEHQEAAQRYRAALAQLREGPGGERIDAFLDFRQAVAEVLEAHQTALEDLGPEPSATERLLLEHDRDARLAQLQERDPAAYGAAVAFLDGVRPPYRRAIRAIRNERAAEQLAHSAIGSLGRAIEPATRPLGFDWKIGTALLGAFGAKEVFVAQMGIVYAVGSEEEGHEALRERLRADYSPLQAFAIMLFCLISMPCVATIAATRRESGRWAWALLQLAGLTALAYLVTLVVYQLGSLLRIGTG
ncbi:MAG: ferrous iron transport protein B [Candidatus Brocadiia bacterium]